MDRTLYRRVTSRQARAPSPLRPHNITPHASSSVVRRLFATLSWTLTSTTGYYDYTNCRHGCTRSSAATGRLLWLPWTICAVPTASGATAICVPEPWAHSAKRRVVCAACVWLSCLICAVPVSVPASSKPCASSCAYRAGPAWSVIQRRGSCRFDERLATIEEAQGQRQRSRGESRRQRCVGAA